MIVVVVVGIIILWVGAWLLRKRYLRKKEREIELSPPVAWGPGQTQGAPSGYTNGSVDLMGNRNPDASGGHYKEAAASGALAGGKVKKPKMAWLHSNKV